VVARRLASLERRLPDDVSPASVGHFPREKIAFMVSGRIHARWAVRLSIAERGGWRSWVEVSGNFERGLVELARVSNAPALDRHRPRDFPEKIYAREGR
jgi:hypothetical protein